MSVKKGIIVVFLGVDGAGKSTTSEVVKSRLEKMDTVKFAEAYMGPWGNLQSPLTRFSYNLGLFPAKESWGNLIREKKKDSTKVKYGYFYLYNKWIRNLIKGSLYYFAVYAEFIYRYFKNVRGNLALGKIVLADRYIYDLRYIYKKREIIDFERLRRWVVCNFPQPDLIVFLWNEADIIISRKAQLDKKEIELFQIFYDKVLNDISIIGDTEVLKLKTDKSPQELGNQIVEKIMALYGSKNK